jgi:hypothetical protein
MSDKSSDDFIEVVLDTSGATPLVVGRTSRAWGNRTNVAEQPLNPAGAVREISEADLLEFLLKGVEPFLGR